MIALLLAAQLVGPPAPSLPAAHADAQASHIAWVAGAVSADLLSTSWGLRRCPTCRESNPLGADVEARLALKIGTAGAIMLATWKLERSGHHNWARGTRWAYVAISGALVANNLAHGIRKK